MENLDKWVTEAERTTNPMIKKVKECLVALFPDYIYCPSSPGDWVDAVKQVWQRVNPGSKDTVTKSSMVMYFHWFWAHNVFGQLRVDQGKDIRDAMEASRVAMHEWWTRWVMDHDADAQGLQDKHLQPVVEQAKKDRLDWLVTAPNDPRGLASPLLLELITKLKVFKTRPPTMQQLAFVLMHIKVKMSGTTLQKLRGNDSPDNFFQRELQLLGSLRGDLPLPLSTDACRPWPGQPSVLPEYLVEVQAAGLLGARGSGKAMPDLKVS